MNRLRPPEQLLTERLRIRRARADDAEAVHASYASDPVATRYLSFPTHTSVADSQRFLEYAVAAWDHGGEFVWAVERHEDRDLLGTVGLRVGDHGLSLGYAFASGAWGQGFATEAASAVVAWGRAQRSVVRIWAWVDVDNVASQRVLTKVGVPFEALIRRWAVHPNVSDAPRDVVFHAWVREDGSGQ